MKKLGVVLLVLCLLMGNAGFAIELGEDLHENVARSDIQEMLFEFEDDQFCLRAIQDMEYHDVEEALYLITPHCEYPREDRQEQYVYDLDGDEIENPMYPVVSDAVVRYSLEIDGGEAYSMEYDYEADTGTSASKVYRLDENELASDVLGSLGDHTWNGQIAVEGNTIVYYTNMKGTNDSEEFRIEEGRPNFYIGSLSPFTSSDASVKVYSETGNVRAFDLTPDGTRLVYGSRECTEFADDPDFMIRIVDTEDVEDVDEFLIENTMDDRAEHRSFIEDLYATDDYIVVLTRSYTAQMSMIQRFTYDGDLIDGVEANFQTSCMTAGPNGSTLYAEKRFDSIDSCEGHYEIVQINWEAYEESSESTGRPKAVISEKTVGGQTTATFKDDGFGLLRAEDPETGVINYLAPLKSDEAKVRIRIPYADLAAKMGMGAENLMITYAGQVIKIPMTAFDCGDLLAGMPCQDDATFEIQLAKDEAGNVTVKVQLFVVEQVNAMTKLVHRKTIQY